MPVKSFIVSASDTAMHEISALSDRLRQAGLVVTQQLDAVGVIIGSADDEALDQLRKVPGVASIEEDRSVQATSDNEDWSE